MGVHFRKNHSPSSNTVSVGKRRKIVQGIFKRSENSWRQPDGEKELMGKRTIGTPKFASL